MAQRLQVSEGWLSRYLYLAKLPSEVVDAFPSPNDLKELHARALKPILANPKSRADVIDRAMWLINMRAVSGLVPGEPWSDAGKVVEDLKRAGQGVPSKRKPKTVPTHVYRKTGSDYGITRIDKGRTIQLELKKDMPYEELKAMMERFLLDRSEGA